MTNRRKENKLFSLKVIHFGLTFLIFTLCYLWFYRATLMLVWHPEADVLLLASYAFLLFMFIRIYNGYMLGYYSVTDLIGSQTLADIISAVMVYIMIDLVFMRLVNPLPLLGGLGVQIMLNLGWTYYANRKYFRKNRIKRTVLIYNDFRDLRRLEEIRFFDQKFEVIKHIKSPENNIIRLLMEIDGADCVCTAGIDPDLRNCLAKYCIESGIEGYFAPDIGDIIIRGSVHMRNYSVPIFKVSKSEPDMFFLSVKRTLDIIGSLAGIVLTGPIMLIVGFAVALCDRGPVFYCQNRLTRNGKVFKIIKFRSMTIDAEKHSGPRLASENDSRITPVGRIIRTVRLDELPQLFNILKGDMSFVGPRPERPEIAEKYEKTIPEFSLRLQTNAGLTGFAQVYGRYDMNPYDKLQLDLMYINRMNIAEDLRIMFATVKVIFEKERSAGVKS